MKSVTEFANITLVKGINAKTALAAEGKSPEEIQTSLGTTFKYEGDKLKYFCNALDVAGENMEGLGRVLVVKLNEGENAPPKAKQVEDMHYVPEFKMEPKAKIATKADFRGKQGGGKKGPKESPWGMSPEEKAAKNPKGKAPAKKS